jgi:DNA-binding response OmpR family regulator
MSKILIVDDEQHIVELLSYNLEKEGFSTVKAYDGEASLGMVRSEKPALMIVRLSAVIRKQQICQSLC